jgi:uncharacterized protein YceK
MGICKIWILNLLSFILLVFIICLGGCGTTGKRTDVDVDINYNITAAGNVIIKPALDQQSTTGNIEDLATDNRPNVPVDLRLTKPADVLQQAIVDTVDEAIFDQAVKIAPPVVIEPGPVPDSDLDKKIIESLKMIPYEDKSGGWMSRPGKDYSPLIIVFNNGCGALDVPDPAVGVFITRDQAVFFPHDPQKPNNMHGAALIHTRKGCVSTEATVYQL